MRTSLIVGSVAVLVACSLAGCGESSESCATAGTAVSIVRTNGSGACPDEVVAGVSSLNGSDTFTFMKAVSCGVDHFTLTVDFGDEDTAHSSCQGTETIMIPDFAEDGGSGTESIAITCSDGTSCTETFDIAFTPQ